MKHSIKHDEMDRFLQRFDCFYDAVIRSIRVRYVEDGSRAVDLELLSRDSSANDEWMRVTISVDGVTDMMIRERHKTTMQVLSDGIHITQMNGSVAVEFGGATDAPTTLAELLESDGFTVGKAIAFEVAPHSHSVE